MTDETTCDIIESLKKAGLESVTKVILISVFCSVAVDKIYLTFTVLDTTQKLFILAHSYRMNCKKGEKSTSRGAKKKIDGFRLREIYQQVVNDHSPPLATDDGICNHVNGSRTQNQ
jgi:hypothetical protein